jgi:hypothetical protein
MAGHWEDAGLVRALPTTAKFALLFYSTNDPGDEIQSIAARCYRALFLAEPALNNRLSERQYKIPPPSCTTSEKV